MKLDVQYLSLEYHTICNLRCTYCSETYYDGKKPEYNVDSLIGSLLNNNALNNCKTIVWGGGEPILDNGFTQLIEKLVDRLPNAGLRVLTNAVKYSKTIEKMLMDDKIFITSSVDAGTDEAYLLVRGRRKLQEVLANLKKYASANASKVTIKYILTKGNSSINEIKAFVNLVKKFNLTGCNFQISSDFKEEIISLDNAILTIVLYGLLNDARCRVVFFDDLLRIRLDEVYSHSEKQIKSKIADMELEHVLADKNLYKSVVIWGAGWQAKYLIEKTLFFKHVNVEYFVDSTASKIGGQFLGYDIFDPSVIINSNFPILIAAVQGYPMIYDAFLKLGVDESRLIKKLIL